MDINCEKMLDCLWKIFEKGENNGWNEYNFIFYPSTAYAVKMSTVKWITKTIWTLTDSKDARSKITMTLFSLLDLFTDFITFVDTCSLEAAIFFVYK